MFHFSKLKAFLYLCVSQKNRLAMKKFLIVAISVISIAACQQRNTKSAGEKPANPLADTANYTLIQWVDSTAKDLGTVKEGPEVEVSFKFRNIGDKPLIVTDVHASCGCTIPEKPKEPFEPGQEGSIKAKFTTAGHVGTNNKTIYVNTNTKGTTEHELKFHIVVEKSK
jgi:hypothetical protein